MQVQESIKAATVDRTHKDYGLRTMPVVSGLNGAPLQPSIGVGHWRTDGNATRLRNAQIRKSSPLSGQGRMELVPGKRAAKHIGRHGDVSGGKANRSPKTVKSGPITTAVPSLGFRLSAGIF
jgi:hypothetical protein